MEYYKDYFNNYSEINASIDYATKNFFKLFPTFWRWADKIAIQCHTSGSIKEVGQKSDPSYSCQYSRLFGKRESYRIW